MTKPFSEQEIKAESAYVAEAPSDFPSENVQLLPSVQRDVQETVTAEPRRRRSPLTAHQYKPGQSGNLGGRPKSQKAAVQALIGDHGELAVEGLWKIATDKRLKGHNGASVRMRAWTALLDRGFGTPTATINTSQEMPPLIIDLVSDADLAAHHAARHEDDGSDTFVPRRPRLEPHTAPVTLQDDLDDDALTPVPIEPPVAPEPKPEPPRKPLSSIGMMVDWLV